LSKHRLKIILGLGVFALLLRIGYLLLAVHHMGMEGFWHWAWDTNTYWAVADEILGDSARGEWALFRVGPGYGAILAIQRLIFGPDPLYPIVFSMVMGALAPVAVYLLAESLFDKPWVSFIAGLLATISPTGITLSTHILTDQTYFTLQCFALVWFVYGLRKGALKWFILAGLGTGLALLVRPSGQLWPILYLIIPLILPLPPGYRTRWQFWRRAAITGGLALLVALSWMVRNYAVEGVFTFGTNGVMTMRDCLWAQIEASRSDKQVSDYRRKWIEADGDQRPPYGQGYQNAADRVFDGFRKNPGLVAKFYFKNLVDNVTAPNGYPEAQLPPKYVPIVKEYNRAFHNWLGYVMLGITLLGLLLLRIHERWTALVILGVTYFYFTLLLGFSFWQGSRLHYPAEMAGNILEAYVLVWLTTTVRSWVKPRRLNPQS
jgi:4-amino-4-deoxy-L-arabinose transferase-like glycosyltransferase